MEFVVSVQPRSWPEPVPEIAAAVRAMYGGRRERPLAVQVRDELGELFSDGDFVAAFGVRGRPGFSPGMLAMITVLQKAEDLTDRQAADAVRTNVAWKYALGLELADAGFDHSVLSEFRARVIAHGLEEKVLDVLLDALRDKGLVAAGGKQRTDSTHVIAAVRELNRLELVGESVRAAVEALSAAAPDWVADVMDVPGWSARYGQRIDSWRLPGAQAKKDQLAVAYGTDGFGLLGAVYAPVSPGWLREIPAVQVLRQVLLQNYTRTVTSTGREVIRRRGSDIDTDGGLPPGHQRLTSPYDTDARRSGKRGMYWLGYKLHVTETCGNQSAPAERVTSAPAPAALSMVGAPNLITNVTTTDATVPDSKMLHQIHQQIADRGLLPGEHYLDSGYPSAELIVESPATFGVTLITPVLGDQSRQGKAHAGFAATDFTVDWAAQQVTCPAGRRSSAWTTSVHTGTEKTVITFSAADCRPCPLRPQCTTAKSSRRQLTLHTQQKTEALRAARAHQNTTDWRTKYRLRAGVESTIAQATAVTGLRRTPYRGLAKTHLNHVFSAVAINLMRLHTWWNGHPLDRTRTSHLTQLEHTLAA